MEIKNLTVAGGGVLGSQIAYQAAYKGINVTVWLHSEGSIERAKPRFAQWHKTYLALLDKMKDDPASYCRGLSDTPDLTAEQVDGLKADADAAFEGLTLTTSLADAVADADVVIEAISEDPVQKTAFYKELAGLLPERTVVATNSSTLLPSMFAEATGRPEKYLAMHFANHIWKMNTAEVMGHPGTGKAAYDQIVDLARQMGMVPLCLHKEQSGYLLNSMLIPLLHAAEVLYIDGVSDVETIDKAWCLGTGAPMGPFRILDMVGLRTVLNIVKLDPKAKDPASPEARFGAKLQEMIDQGRTGAGAGKGFYDYE